MIINVTGVTVENNPAPCTEGLRFQIQFECLPPGVQEDIEWKLVYMGSPENNEYDQVLEVVDVGPIQIGRNTFTFQSPPPDLTQIPISDLVELTALLLICSYKNREFIRVGYYVRNTFNDLPLGEDGNPIYPTEIDPSKMTRYILADEPRVTRIHIPWDNDEAIAPTLTDAERELLAELPKDDVEIDVCGDDAELIASGYYNDEDDEEEEEEGEEDPNVVVDIVEDE